MAILNILTYPDDFLRQKAKPVENVNNKVQEIIEDMIETMYAAPGSGLAAIQVGIDKSIFIYDISPVEEGQSPEVLINPTIVSS
jgi:peptide deformylase